MDLNSLMPDEGLPPAPKMAWSLNQETIFTCCSDDIFNLSIEAVAGSGKTTTLVEAIDKCPGSTKVFLAFNKAIADELRRKVPDDCIASTFHSYGLRMCKANGITAKVEPRKVAGIVRRRLSKAAMDAVGYDVVALISGGKNHFLHPADVTRSDFQEMANNSELFFDEQYEDLVWTNIVQLYQEACSLDTGMDFDDMIFQPLLNKFVPPPVDVMFVDEAQDLNYLQHVFLQTFHERGTRIICVGDSYQAIYGFRGAKDDSMNLLAKMFNATRLPLDISYRCPQAIVEHAQMFVPHIKWNVDNPIKGNVVYLEEYPEISEYKTNDMIVCRNNYPLFHLGMKFVKQRMPCQVRTNHGRQLISFIKKFSTVTTTELARELEKWLTNETRKAKELGQQSKLSYIEEKYHIVRPFCDEYETTDEVIECLNQLLHGKYGPILSSVHKAKGLEAEHVYILRSDLMPSKYATSAAQQQQEENLHYVAITRAIDTLFYLPNPEGKY